MSSNQHTKSNYDCEAIKELIPNYVFGLATTEETMLVEARLAFCPEAKQHLADFRQLQDEMRIAVPQLEPSTSLEARLMASIASSPQAPKRPSFSVQWKWAWVAVATLALVLSNVYLLMQLNRSNDRYEQLLQTQTEGDRAFILTTTSNLRWVRLPASEQNGNANAFLMWNAESKIGLLYASGFPKLATDITYQLWLTRGEKRTSAGIFHVDEEGKGSLLFYSDEPIDEYTWARITAEPENGSEEPTGSPVVLGEL